MDQDSIPPGCFSAESDLGLRKIMYLLRVSALLNTTSRFVNMFIIRGRSLFSTVNSVWFPVDTFQYLLTFVNAFRYVIAFISFNVFDVSSLRLVWWWISATTLVRRYFPKRTVILWLNSVGWPGSVRNSLDYIPGHALDWGF